MDEASTLVEERDAIGVTPAREAQAYTEQLAGVCRLQVQPRYRYLEGFRPEALRTRLSNGGAKLTLMAYMLPHRGWRLPYPSAGWL